MAVAKDKLDIIQGDVWSKGFPKNNETYYFFSIAPGKAKEFSQSLKQLAKTSNPTSLISSLTVAKADQNIADDAKKAHKVAPLSNALIAFTRKGLDAIKPALPSPIDLELTNVRKTDPAFYNGMAEDQKVLDDPPFANWDSLFTSTSTPIHGMLKVAGSDEVQVETRLQAILKVLQHGNVTLDVEGTSQPTTEKSRVKGQTRPKEPIKLNGKEHFGFEDGISQPLIDGIDDEFKAVAAGVATMNTNTDVIIVSASSNKERGTRPTWMNDGTFLVFRKLEQDVKAFRELTDAFVTHKCASKGQMGAKLMGRWESGAPVCDYPDKEFEEPEKARLLNSFVYTETSTSTSACPLAAHIRKTNPRDPPDLNKPASIRAKIIRNGIPYGSEFSDTTKDEKRGLLFACYQSHIEDGFRLIQSNWANDKDFPRNGAGHDPIIGQSSGKKLSVTISDAQNQPHKLDIAQMVTLKGGEYFFVPSIKVLRETLGQD